MPAGCSYNFLKTSAMVSIFEMINFIIDYLFIYFSLLLPHMKTHHQLVELWPKPNLPIFSFARVHGESERFRRGNIGSQSYYTLFLLSIFLHLFVLLVF